MHLCLCLFVCLSISEQGRFQFYQRSLARQKAAQADFLKRRSAENEARLAQGKDPLPDEDFSKLHLFKPLSKPNRLDTYLISNQIGHYCNSILDQSAQAFQKLYLVEALQKAEKTPLTSSSSSSSSS